MQLAVPSSVGKTVTWRVNVMLGALGFALAFAVAQFQTFPGYLDSDYYFGGGLRLAQGYGFSEPYIWNYIDEPDGLPHPSHSYWMPLASLITAAGMVVTGQTGYEHGRLGFIVLAAAVPVITAALAYAFGRRRDLAIVSGLLGAFSIYYLPFLPVPDNYGAYLILGALFFLMMGRPARASFFAMGLIAGTMNLARSDGLLWLVLAGVAAVLSVRLPDPNGLSKAAATNLAGTQPNRFARGAVRLALVLAGFAIVMGPWYARNFLVHGSIMAPGGARLLWLTTYDETFMYPAGQLTFGRWMAQGLPAILAPRLAALRWNLLNAAAAQGGIFLLPFILIGAWSRRREVRVQLAVLGWLGLLAVMTLAFPFAGARGGFFHAGAGLQAVWWTLAPQGLETVVAAARRRNFFTPQAFVVFRAALVGIAALMTGLIVTIRVLPGWGEGEQAYPKVEAYLVHQGAKPGDIVMVRNPPGYFILTGRSAIVVPYAGADGMLAAARRYGAKYLIIESAGAAGPIRDVYENGDSQSIVLLEALNGIHVYRIQP